MPQGASPESVPEPVPEQAPESGSKSGPAPELAEAGLADSSTGVPVEEAAPPSSRVDFAEVIGHQFLICGWVLGFTDSVRIASVEVGGFVLDLVKQASIVPRRDVAEHFGLASGNDRHGFYALIDLPSACPPVTDLLFRVNLSSGETSQARWPVSFHDASTPFAPRPYLGTLRELLRQLPKYDARRLTRFASPALGPDLSLDYLSSLPLPVEFGLDLCCVLDSAVLVVAGWRLDPADELTRAELSLGGSVFPFLEEAISFARPDISSELTRGSKRSVGQLAGFIFVKMISPHDAQKEEAHLLFSTAAASVRMPQVVVTLPDEARRDLLSLTGRMDPDAALILIDHLMDVLGDSSSMQPLSALLKIVRSRTIERLPSSLQQTRPRYALYLDQVIPVADSGIFLIGWFNAEPGAHLTVSVQSGAATFVVSDVWNRHTRADVTSHLASSGIATPDHEHGFSCYVPLPGLESDCYIAVTTDTGALRRMSVVPQKKPEAALQTIRSLLTSFSSRHPELRSILNRHIGPAVSAAWASRRNPSIVPVLHSFGPAPASPAVSIVVPLFGRYDFAQYQLALFADDPDFQHVELIYFVDDPAIAAEFIRSCTDLYGIFRVPFVVAAPGVNLGFAGANNLAATIARGRHLLFMNSDVLPLKAGWVGQLLASYAALEEPGVLGAKLLYEDGSVQHAGMAFRRYPGWADLWINDHPFKGQSPLALNGRRELDCVTAACILTEASLFTRMGGFCEDYIIGDFEDSDLCLRLIAAGRRNYIDLDVELYHLERQSQNTLNDISWRTNLTLYNCWLHDRRWDELISARTGEANVPLLSI